MSTQSPLIDERIGTEISASVYSYSIDECLGDLSSNESAGKELQCIAPTKSGNGSIVQSVE
jgi:hypothetical protein